MPAPLYHTAPDGQRYRVLDYRYGPPHHGHGSGSYHEAPDAEAAYRVFVSAWGGRWQYAFRAGEDRTPSPRALARQLRWAAYVPPTGEPLARKRA